MYNRPTIILLLSVFFLVSTTLTLGRITPPPIFQHNADRDYKGTNCEACQAVVKQALRKLPGYGNQPPDLSTQKARRAREQKISDLVEGLCKVDSFGRYEYSPPTMVSACNDFLSEYGEELETILYKGVMPDRDIRVKLCLDTKLCSALWTPEAEEQKRDRSPEESRIEAERQRQAAIEEKKKKKAEEKNNQKKKKKKEEDESATQTAANKSKTQQPQQDQVQKTEL